MPNASRNAPTTRRSFSTAASTPGKTPDCRCVENKGQPIEIMRQVQITAGSLVFTGTALGALVHPGFYVTRRIRRRRAGVRGRQRLLHDGAAIVLRAVESPRGQGRHRLSEALAMFIHAADIATVLSGSAVGFILALVGGGGSILAVPLLVYGVGVASPHVAIGTSAIAVAISALANMIAHWSAGNVRWPCAIVFSLAGVAGAFAGASVAKQLDGQNLLIAVRHPHDRNRRTDAEEARRRRRSHRPPDGDERATADADACRHRLRGRPACRLLRHRRRLPDRSRPDAGDRHAADHRHRHLAGRRRRLWRFDRRSATQCPGWSIGGWPVCSSPAGCWADWPGLQRAN